MITDCKGGEVWNLSNPLPVASPFLFDLLSLFTSFLFLMDLLPSLLFDIPTQPLLLLPLLLLMARWWERKLVSATRLGLNSLWQCSRQDWVSTLCGTFSNLNRFEIQFRAFKIWEGSSHIEWELEVTFFSFFGATSSLTPQQTDITSHQKSCTQFASFLGPYSMWQCKILGLN